MLPGRRPLPIAELLGVVCVSFTDRRPLSVCVSASRRIVAPVGTYNPSNSNSYRFNQTNILRTSIYIRIMELCQIKPLLLQYSYDCVLFLRRRLGDT